MKRKRITSSLQSSSQQIILYLPDDCWESIFKFIINNNDENSLKCLSLVSKQFLSITNRLRFSLNIKEATRPFLFSLFKRFTNLTSLDFSYCHYSIGILLRQISIFFPLKLTSLKLPMLCTFPANGLRTFSRNVTTLTSLTCSGIYFDIDDLLPIVDCFPLLKELNICRPKVPKNNETNFVSTIQRLLSKSPCIQHLELQSTYFLNNQHVVDFCLCLGNLVSINLNFCHHLTETTLFSLVRNCYSLIEVKMECTAIGKENVGNSDSLVEYGVYPQLKSLYLGHNSWLNDEIIILYASIFPNLKLLDLQDSPISEGICQGLRKCCKLKHLNLEFCSGVKLHGINFAVPKLEVLNLSNTKVDNETLYMISKNCCGLLRLLLEKCNDVTEKGVKHVVKNCTQLREINLAGFHLSLKIRKLISRRGCHLC
ncbi:putative leucine-rich repeat domain, L domain-containing protein [Medicago truncatula]|uniref:F-box/RNI superfamily protein n=1 Tax=Medicago truncatula TaxID=3880 RepID=A0A072U9G2_MEDTR|nr:F-box/RNI superfamily protein [Medicago truncatula]RHN51294.1 putative leucine-rich repeat domain, L domain-containing protein [Medicago truncatula]